MQCGKNTLIPSAKRKGLDQPAQLSSDHNHYWLLFRINCSVYIIIML